MSDPFSDLKNSLITVFLSTPKRKERYSIVEVQTLNEAISNYNPKQTQSIYPLLNAIQEAYPHISERVNEETLKKSLNALCDRHNIPRMKLKLPKPKGSYYRFQYGGQYNHKKMTLTSWLALKTGLSEDEINKMNKTALTKALADYCNDTGFSTIFKEHLNKVSEYLINLAMSSDENFRIIAQSKLNLFLDDKSLAEAIKEHADKLCLPNQDISKQTENLIDKINELLTNGRSVHTLLNNTKAKVVLDDLFREREKKPTAKP